MLLVALLACGGDPQAPPDPTDPDPCDGLDWHRVGEPFVTTWCTTCHAPGLTGPSRFGAPDGLDLDTLDAVRTWEARIRAVAVGDDATMPPASPAPAAERARFEAWLDCGAPGTDAPDPAPACVAGTSTGDWIASDGPPCPGIDHVAGDLVLDADAGEGFACLCAVDGDVVVAGARAVDLPALSSARSVRAVDVPALERLELPLLTTLETVEVRDAPALAQLGLHRLARVDGDLVLAGAPALGFLQPLDALEAAGGDVVLDDLGVTDPYLLRRLEAVGGSLSLQRHAAWTALRGFDALASVGGDLVVQANPSLVALPGMPGPVYVGGDLIVLDNPLLTGSAALSWSSRLEVAGEVVW
jgi:hypothetical protein